MRNVAWLCASFIEGKCFHRSCLHFEVVARILKTLSFVCRYSANFVNATAEVQSLLQDLQSIYNTFQKPLWLTEFAQINYGSPDAMFPSYDQQLAFMGAAVPALEAVPYLERFAWYALFPDQLYSNDTAALYNNDGSPTPAGTLYATF